MGDVLFKMYYFDQKIFYKDRQTDCGTKFIFNKEKAKKRKEEFKNKPFKYNGQKYIGHNEKYLDCFDKFLQFQKFKRFSRAENGLNASN